MFAYYSANQYFYDDMEELDMNIQSASTSTSLIVNNSTTVAGQAITFTGARQRSPAHAPSFCSRHRAQHLHSVVQKPVAAAGTSALRRASKFLHTA